MLSSTCSICGQPYSIASAFCPFCGNQRQHATQSRRYQSKRVASNDYFSTLESGTTKNPNTVPIIILCFVLIGVGVLSYLLFWGDSKSGSRISGNSEPERNAVATTKLRTPNPTPTPKPARIVWKFLQIGELRYREGESYYFFGDGFMADVPREGNRDSTVHVYVPEQYRRSSQGAAAAAATATCDVESYIGSKVIALYEGQVVGYRFKLRSGTDLLVVPSSRELKSVVMVQTLPGREPIIRYGEVTP